MIYQKKNKSLRRERRRLPFILSLANQTLLRQSGLLYGTHIIGQYYVKIRTDKQ